LDYIGDAIPDFTYGITLTAGWKGLDFTLFGTGSQGNDIFNCINRPDYAASNKLKEVFYDNRWTADNKSGTVPRAGAQNMDKYQTSDALVYDGSFFKIKQIQLGYTLPKTWMKKIFVNNLRVYGSLDDFFPSQNTRASIRRRLPIPLRGWVWTKGRILVPRRLF
jgi:hypothetical protein